MLITVENIPQHDAWSKVNVTTHGDLVTLYVYKICVNCIIEEYTNPLK
jgi:hypothetical protein